MRGNLLITHMLLFFFIHSNAFSNNMYFLIAVFLWIFYCFVSPVSSVREDTCALPKLMQGKRDAGATVAQEKKCEESLHPPGHLTSS